MSRPVPKARRAELKAQYLAFDGPLSEFAKATGVGLSLLKQYSTQDGWQEAKAAVFGEGQKATGRDEGGEATKPQSVRQRLLAGELSIADALREDSRANIAWLMGLRENPNAPAASRQQAAQRLAEFSGVEGIKQDLEAEQEHEPLTDAEVDELFALCRRIKGIRATGLETAAELLAGATDGAAATE